MPSQDRGARVEKISMARVHPRAFTSRGPAGEAEIQRLAASIRQHGLLQPILVRPMGRDYEVVCGQRRFEACKVVHHEEIVAVVRTLDDRQALELSLVENVRREGLNPEERRQALARLAALFPGLTKDDLEAWIGPARSGASGSSRETMPAWLDAIPETDTRAEDVTVMMAGESEAPTMPAAVVADSEEAPVAEDPEMDVLVRPDGAPVRQVVRHSLLQKVKLLLSRLSKTSLLDTDLLHQIVGELMSAIDHTPLPDFLDLTSRARAGRQIARHSLNVTKIAMFLARSLGLTKEEVEQVAICALLHDVGMMKVDDAIFAKHTALDQTEWEQVKGHPTEGSMLLTKEAVLQEAVARVALEHHERPDGTGYPHGKKKDEIHFYARLINVADTYGALVSPRAHRLPLLPHHAMRSVMDSGGRGVLDWDIVQVFVKAMSMYPIGSYVRLSGGEIARVVRAQPEFPEKPVIAVLADAQRNVLPAPLEFDLAAMDPSPKIEPVPPPF